MKIYSIVIAFLSTILFGIATPFSKTLLQDFSTFQLAGILYLGGILGVIPILLKDYKKENFLNKNINRKNIFNLASSIFFGGILGPVFLLLGLNFATASSVSMWLNLEMVTTAIIGYFFFKDHIEFNQWFSILGVTLSGILLTLGEGSSGIIAGIFVLLACISWGLDNHFAALVDEISPSESTFLKGLIAGSFNLIIGLLTSTFISSYKTLFLALLLGAFSYGLSISLHITASQQMGATRVQMIFSSSPFFGILFSIILLNESLNILQIISGIILFISLIILFKGKHEHNHDHEEIEHNHMHRHDDGHHNHTHDNLPLSTRHSHSHKHEFITHSHNHLPDIHHRHKHS